MLALWVVQLAGLPDDAEQLGANEQQADQLGERGSCQLSGQFLQRAVLHLCCCLCQLGSGKSLVDVRVLLPMLHEGKHKALDGSGLQVHVFHLQRGHRSRYEEQSLLFRHEARRSGNASCRLACRYASRCPCQP